MAKFMCLQVAGAIAAAKMTPEQMQAGMQARMDWVQQGTALGWLLDPGSPLSSKEFLGLFVQYCWKTHSTRLLERRKKLDQPGFPIGSC